MPKKKQKVEIVGVFKQTERVISKGDYNLEMDEINMCDIDSTFRPWMKHD